MERRVLLAIFLAFLVLYVWQAVFVKPVPKSPVGSSPVAGSTPGTTTASSPAEVPAPSAPAAKTAEAGPPPVTSATLVGETSERDVRIETRDVIAVFTNRGARLKSWRLKHYLDAQRQPQELIEHETTTQPLPFTLRTSNEAETAALNSALYSVSGAPAV